MCFLLLMSYWMMYVYIAFSLEHTCLLFLAVPKPVHQDSFLCKACDPTHPHWNLWLVFCSPGGVAPVAKAEQWMSETVCFFVFLLALSLSWAGQQRWESNGWEPAWDQSAYLMQVCVQISDSNGSRWPAAVFWGFFWCCFFLMLRHLVSVQSTWFILAS